MKSFLKDVLSKSSIKELQNNFPNNAVLTEEDKELEELLKSLKTVIRIIGCGGGGSNTINRLMEEGVLGADLIAANTDAQHLLIIKAQKKILLGKRTTRGLGAGALPQIGEQAAKEAEENIRNVLQGSHIVF
ncbi:MAG: cell division protein FtsZ, partial [Thermoplasmata archaeon]